MRSNKFILILSIVIFLGTFFIFFTVATKYGVIVITGFTSSNDTGELNLTISTAASIKFLDSLCLFGSGSVEEESTCATVWSNGTAINVTNPGTDWAGCDDGLNLTNNGNADVAITLDSSLDVATFIGGDESSRKFQWKSSNDSLCTIAGEIYNYTDVAANALACGNLTSSGTIKIDFKLQIPEDAPPGTKGTIITATGTSL